MIFERVHRDKVTVKSLPFDGVDCDRADETYLSVRFPFADVRNMHLDGGYRHGFHGVGKRNARMRISRGIEHDAVNVRKVRALDFVDERAFVVRLENSTSTPISSACSLTFSTRVSYVSSP